jgi:hypothetical protein
MISVHWYYKIYNNQYDDLFKFAIGPNINLSVNQIMMYEEWCENQFGQEKSMHHYGDWERVGAGFFTFKNKEDMLIFLLTWQDMEIE